MSTRDQLNSYIEQLERRLRLGAVLRGAAILTSAALVATVLLVLITNAFAFSWWSITSARVVLLVRAGFGRRASDLRCRSDGLNRRRAAGKAENVFPQFQQRLVTFAERDAGRTRTVSRSAGRRHARNCARTPSPSGWFPTRSLLALLGVGAGLAGGACLDDRWPGRVIWAMARRCCGQARTPGAGPFYDIQVTPGDASVRRNADQSSPRSSIGLQTDKVRLYARYQSASKWEQVAMQPQPGGSGFQFVFAGLAGKRRILRRSRRRCTRTISIFASWICPA